jgi:hypothetical protein
MPSLQLYLKVAIDKPPRMRPTAWARHTDQGQSQASIAVQGDFETGVRHEDQATGGRGRHRRRRRAEPRRAGRECRRIPARRIERTRPFGADFHHRAGALRAVARHRQRPGDHVVDGYRFRRVQRTSPRSRCRRSFRSAADAQQPSAHRRDSPIPPALPRPTISGQLHQIPVPVIRLGHPRTWVMAAVRCGAHARQTHPTCPVRLIGRGPIRTGPTRPTRWSRLLHSRRLASHRHNGRMLRLPSRSNTGAGRSPPPSTVACDSGLLVLRKLGPAGRVRMPDAS